MAWPGLALASDPMPVLPSPATPPVAGSADPGLPSPLGPNRFSVLAKKSPFTLASTSEEVVDFAKDLILSGYFRMDGKDFVMVANRTRPERLMVGTEPSPSAQGLLLVSVERDPSGDPTKLKAKILKGMETATLKYESAASPAAVSAVPGAPGAPAAPSGMAVPLGVTVPMPVPPIPGVNQAAPGAPGQAAQKPAMIRRRVIPVPPALNR